MRATDIYAGRRYDSTVILSMTARSPIRTQLKNPRKEHSLDPIVDREDARALSGVIFQTAF